MARVKSDEEINKLKKNGFNGRDFLAFLEQRVYTTDISNHINRRL